MSIRIVKQEEKENPCENCWSKPQLPSCNVLCTAFGEWCAYQDMLESNTIEVKLDTKPPDWIKYRKQHYVAIYGCCILDEDCAHCVAYPREFESGASVMIKALGEMK